MKKALLRTILLVTTGILLIACSDDTTQEEEDTSSSVDTATSQPKSKDNTEEESNEDKQQEKSESDESDADESNEIPTTEEDNQAENNDSANNDESKKDEYLDKLNDTKEETDEMQENPRDDTTFALKEVEGNRYDIWDEMLNDIYGVLEEQLPSEEMEQLRTEQKEWLDYREQTAKEASLEYEGGTMELLEYVKVENDLTEERSYELVEEYME